MIPEDELKPGDRFRLSLLGIERCPKLATSSGTIVNVTRMKSLLRVRFDGTKSVRSFHRSYIVPICGKQDPAEIGLMGLDEARRSVAE
jgi:hypothetical protein